MERRMLTVWPCSCSIRRAIAMKGSRSPSVPTSSITTLSGGTGSDGATATRPSSSDGAEVISESDGAGTAASRPTIPGARPSQASAARGGGEPSSSMPLAQGSALPSIIRNASRAFARASAFAIARDEAIISGRQCGPANANVGATNTARSSVWPSVVVGGSGLA
jgi:hypothetical protein